MLQLLVVRKLENSVFSGGQAGAIDHITIGDRAVLACYTVAMKNLTGGKIYSGVPAREIREKKSAGCCSYRGKTVEKKIRPIRRKI